MSSFPVTPRGTPKRGIGGCLLVALLVLVIGGTFIWNMAPNLVSFFIPGGREGLTGEWVGLVTVKSDMMSQNTAPAAIKLTMKPASLASIIPSYKLVGEITDGHAAPVTFTVNQMTTFHDKVEMTGFIDEASAPAFQKGHLEGNLTNQQLTLDFNSMSSSTMSFKGTLKKGTDSDYAALLKQVQ